MMLFLFTAAVAAAATALPGDTRNAPIVLDSTEICRFRTGSGAYDLCPIFGGSAIEWPLLVKGEDGGEHWLQLYTKSRSLDDGCPSGSDLCLISRASGQTSRTFGAVVPVIYARESTEFIRPADGGVELRFICDPQIERGEPMISQATASDNSNVQYLSWRTRIACRIGGHESPQSLHAFDAPAPSGQDSEDPSENNEGEDLLESDRQRKSRRSTAIVFAVVSIVIISISIISYRYPDHLNLFFSTRIKPLLHRLSPENLPRFSLPHSLKPAGESRLLRWAQEDLELDEDIMVNGSDAYYESDDLGDESIPLRPSPRKGGRSVKNYGSATSPFW
ncbi:hypothetical protein R3P38DRAFT_2860752 [Favolaschia claudopus]|uniref:Autophagy-related protein 27 n=1 Tax=Favolaschia claudopus TaxID=2862362 RepID=A0AAW0DLQ6_9AGAR